MPPQPKPTAQVRLYTEGGGFFSAAFSAGEKIQKSPMMRRGSFTAFFDDSFLAEELQPTRKGAR
jgi:hypothetical protein